MADDVVIGKAALIERCLLRIREVHAGDDRRFTQDPLRQESILLNLQRACEASIDLAMHLVRVRRLGVPQGSREAFDLLREGGVIDASLADRLKRMVGFRNVVVHAYHAIDEGIVLAILRDRLGDFLEFTRVALRS